MTMITHFAKGAVAALALIALPGMAQAGTATDTKTATFRVVSQCSISGATVNLGTFKTTDTWADVIAVHGWFDEFMVYYPGTAGPESLNLGSITCDSGVQYTFKIEGSPGFLSELRINGKWMDLGPVIKKLGGVPVPDSSYSPGVGNPGWLPTAGVGTSALQSVVGSMAFQPYFYVGTAPVTDKLTVPGSYSGTLKYTLNF